MTEETEVKSFEEVLNSTGVLCHKNVGVSMLPLIKEGRDIMVIKSRAGRPLRRMDAVLYIRPGVEGRGHYVMHRILKDNCDGTYFIIGDNCIAGENVKDENIIGVLDSLSRKGRTVRLDSFGCRLYADIWYLIFPIRVFLKKLRGKAAGIYHRIKKDRTAN